MTQTQLIFHFNWNIYKQRTVTKIYMRIHNLLGGESQETWGDIEKELWIDVDWVMCINRNIEN